MAVFFNLLGSCDKDIATLSIKYRYNLYIYEMFEKCRVTQVYNLQVELHKLKVNLK